MNAILMKKSEHPIAAYNEFRAQLAEMKASNSAVVFDYQSAKGNKEARSHVYKLRQTKSAVEKARKNEKAIALEYGRKVDAEAKEIVTEIEDMISVHQKPLDEIEEREKERIQKHKDLIEGMRKVATQTHHPDGQPLTAAEHQMAVDYLTGIDVDDSWEEFVGEAGIAKDESLKIARANLKDRRKYEAEQTELERLRKEAEERARQDREDQIRREAAERARAEAEAKAQREKNEAEAKAKSDREESEKRELKAKLAAETAERHRVEAEQRAKEAEERARIKAQWEIEEAKRKEKAEAEKREANKRHAAKIHNEALACFTKAGISETEGKNIISLIASGAIKHVSIRY